MPTQTIKLRLYPTAQQCMIFGQWNYADQMFRNFSVSYLRKRYQDRKAWIHHNHQKPEYLAWKAEVDILKEAMKVFKKEYPTDSARKEAKAQGLCPVYPPTIDPVFDDDYASLSAQLTKEIDKSKQWLLRQLDIMHAAGLPVPQIKKFPKSVSECVNGLPFGLRRQLQKIARNEDILFYTLFAPRTVFNQTINDLKKTYTKAFSNLKQGKVGREAGFPKFHKISRHGGVRLQVDARNPGFANAWKAQQIVLTEFDTLRWRDSGYRLPDDCAKMITVKKSPCGQFFATFVGKPTYKSGKVAKAIPEIASATSVEEFLDTLTESFDLNRRSGFPIMIGSQLHTDPDDVESHIISPLKKVELAKMQAKIKKEEGRIEYYQAQESRQRAAAKQAKKKNKRNPNSAHRHSKVSHRAIKTRQKINFAFDALNNLRDFYKLALARLMVRGRKVIMIEDLDVKGMQEAERPANRSQKHHKNDKHSQHVSGFGALNRELEEQCLKHNVVLLRCGQYDPSSQICHKCGYRWGKLDTNIRQVTCTGCKTVHDRDENAFQNIKFMALYRYINGDKDLNNLEALHKEHPLPKSNSQQQTKNKSTKFTCNIPAERVGRVEAVSIDRFESISHEEIRAYIDGKYPIDVVLSTYSMSKASEPCGNPNQAVEQKWHTPQYLAKLRKRQGACEHHVS